MSETERTRKETEWTDPIPDEEEETESDYENTYRDGSAVHECWPEDK